MEVVNDGNVRTADIYLPGNRYMQRSINMLYPLELNDGQVDQSRGDNQWETVLYLKMQGILRINL